MREINREQLPDCTNEVMPLPLSQSLPETHHDEMKLSKMGYKNGTGCTTK